MDQLKIRNWDKWQTYRSDRGQPPWIKIHRCIMRNFEWVSLSDAERGQLVSMWLLAADHNGVIPADPEIIQKLCFMSKPPNINRFIELDFIDKDEIKVGVKSASSRRQVDQPEAETETETEVDTCPEPSDSGPEPDNIFLLFPTNRKNESHPILKDDIKSWAELYPAVNVEQEIRAMLGWLKANPTKRKTESGIPRFINAWLSREQDSNKGMNYGTNKQGSSRRDPTCRSDGQPWPTGTVF